MYGYSREPGYTHKEDWETGTVAAAMGGVTTVFEMLLALKLLSLKQLHTQLCCLNRLSHEFMFWISHLLVKLAKMLFDEEKFVPILGATRSLSAQYHINALLLNQLALNPWSPDLSQFDAYCLTLDQPVLSRTSDGGELTITLASGTAKKNGISCAVDSQSLLLNEYLDLAHSDVTAFLSDRLESIIIHVLEIGKTTLIEPAAWMVEQNYQYQAVKLLAKGK